jgi:dihydrofolate synthase/folylpolyglutamate synthase
MDAALLYLPEKAALRNVTLSTEGTAFTVEFSGGFGLDRPLFPGPLDLSIRIPGEIQAWNAALAIAAVKTAFPLTGAEAVTRGLASLSLPARFERLSLDPLLIIDGAHTERSMEACVKTFTELYGEGGVLIFGCAASKDAAALARLLIPHFSRIIITTPGTYKVSYPEEVFEAFRKEREGGSLPPRQSPAVAGLRLPPQRGLTAPVTPPDPSANQIFAEIALLPDTALAVRQGIKKAREEKLPVLGTGSFYMAAEIRALYRAGNLK